MPLSPPSPLNSRSESRWADLASIVFLVFLAGSLFRPYLTAPGLATDLYSFLRETYEGVMPWGSFDSHRPFRTITWNIASFFSGYSKVGFQIMVAVLHLFNSIALYWIVRLFRPDLRVLALCLAILRLMYAGAIIESTDDIIIEALFPETVSLIAALVFAYLQTNRPPNMVNWLGLILIPALLVLSMGMYEQVWANICLFPVALVLTGCISIKDRASLVRLGVWFGTAGAFIVWYFIDKKLDNPSYHLASQNPVFPIWCSLTKILTVDSILQPLEKIEILSQSSRIWIPVAFSIAVFGIVFWFGRRQSFATGYSWSNVWKLLLISLLWWSLGYPHMAIGLATTYGNVATWGSRFLLSMSYPVAFVSCSVATAICIPFPIKWRTTVFSVLIALMFFCRSATYVEGWQSIVERGRTRENIEIALSEAVPSVQPGTVLLIENFLPQEPKELKIIEDLIFTHTRRSLYGTENVFVFFTSPSFPAKETQDGVEIETEMVYPYSLQPERPYHGIGADGRYWHPYKWVELGKEQIQWVEIKRENLVWLRYEEGEFQVLEEKSNPELIKGEWNRVMRGVYGDPPGT